MRILFVNAFHYVGAGASTYAFNLADLIRKNGHQIAFFAMQDDRNIPDPNADLFVSHIDFRDLNQHKNLVTGFKVLERSIYSTEARAKFSLLLDRFQPDIIHLHNIHAQITPSIIFEAKKRGLPVVWTLHDHKLLCPNSHYLIDSTGQICEACGSGKYYQPILKRCKKGSLSASFMAGLEAYAHRAMHVREKVNLFLVPSQFLEGNLIKYGFPKEKCMHLPLFIPDDGFINNSQGFDSYFLFFGRIDKIKGITTLLEAAHQSPETRIILAGRADQSFLKSLGTFPSNVEFVGMKTGQELRQLISGALAVVLPSICYENQPFSILEAFAAGKPVIASNLGGNTELLSGGERGLLFSPGNVSELGAAMKWMLQNPELVKRFGNNAFAYASLNHSSDHHYAVLKQVYKSLINNA
jgi:glycosyltransferase involved in cell wall biosynthesis